MGAVMGCCEAVCCCASIASCCTCCCKSCPSSRSSIVTRIIYAVILLLSAISAWSMLDENISHYLSEVRRQSWLCGDSSPTELADTLPGPRAL
jgi:hypothetical protein